MLPILAALFLLAPSAYAGVADIGAPTRTMNVGIVYDTGPGSALSAPGTSSFFTVLNQRADTTPVGWRFVNPYPGGGFMLPSLQSPAAQNQYWYVNIYNMSVAQLSKYQALVVSTSGADPGLPVPDTEALRQYVDGGGILWFDFTGSPSGSGTTSLWTELSGWFTMIPGSFTPPVMKAGSGIEAISAPYDLTQSGLFGANTWASTATPAFMAQIDNPTGPTAILFSFDLPWDWQDSAPDIEETHYGSGAVVISGTGIFSITTPSSITTTDLQFEPGRRIAHARETILS